MATAQRRSRTSLRARAGFLRALRIVRATPLFDAAYYRSRWSDVAESGMEAAEHYTLHGAVEGRDPSHLFDANFYVAADPQLQTPAINPLVHYLTQGASEGRSPHALFDPAYYLRQYPDVARTGLTPLEHFVVRGAAERKNPHPLFDVAFYLRSAPEIASRMNPLVHYLLYGAIEGCNPHPLFDGSYYLETYPDVAALGITPLVHYVLHGAVEGRNPHPLFDASFYLRSNPGVAAAGLNPLVHYLAEGAPIRLDGPGVAQESEGEPVVGEGVREDGKHVPDVVLLGRFYQVSGLGEDARSMLRSLNQIGLSCRALNTRPPEGKAESEFRVLCGGQQTDRLGAVNVFLQNADEVDHWLGVLERPPRPHYNIVRPMWELSRYPEQWAKQLDRFDEIWLVSQFVYDAISKVVSKPSFLVPLPAEVGSAPRLGKDRFGIDTNDFAFLFAFDLSGIVDRKNPLAVIDAFRRVRRARPQSRIKLLLKVHDSHKRLTVPAELVRQAAEDTDGIVLIDETLGPPGMRGLLRAADCFVSLHRSEGFGRGLAEAMYCGKPCIATGYSGNMQFMNEDNSALVRYELVPVAEDAYPFWQGQVWAEPDIDHAVWQMTRLLDDPSAAAALGAKAVQTMRAAHSYRAVGRCIEARLAAIVGR